MRRDWTDVQPLVAATARVLEDYASPATTFRLDQRAAVLRDALDSAGVCSRDPDELHTGLTFLRILVHQAQEAACIGTIDHRSAAIVRYLVYGVVADLLHLLPAEARA